jgi:pyruvate,orthophosphate dikinase
VKKGGKKMPETQSDTSSKYNILKDIVQDYPGILQTTEPLIKELGSEPKKWGNIVKEVRAYALKNFYLHDHHEQGIGAIELLANIFMDAVDSPELFVRQEAIDSLLVYLEKILLDGDRDITKYNAILQSSFIRLLDLPEKTFYFLISNPHQVMKIGRIILERGVAGFDPVKVNALISRALLSTYEYWLGEEDPSAWFVSKAGHAFTEDEVRKLEELFYPVSHPNLRGLILHLSEAEENNKQYQLLENLLQFPGYMQLVKFYEDLVRTLSKTEGVQKNLRILMLYLLRIIEIDGLSAIHESTLREINRTVNSMIRDESPEQRKEMLAGALETLKVGIKKYPETVLYCIQNIGNAIYALGDSKLVEWFIRKIISMEFQYPRIEGTTLEWQVRSNRAHLKNIRVWLELIENDPKWSKYLISALIINLKLSSVHISDTDLFQKDITRLLNSDIRPAYHLVKQLCKVFPVYFSDINAEGKLRQVSTEMDEMTGRADILVHFLRKQSHVESSARVVDFIEEVIRFWRTLDKTPLKRFLADEVYNRIETAGPFIDDLNRIYSSIFRDTVINDVKDLLGLTEDEIVKLVGRVEGVSERESKRACLAIRFYQQLNKKYKLDAYDIIEQLKYAPSLGLPNTDELIALLQEGNPFRKLEGILGYLGLLKEIVLSPEHYEPLEYLFRKRHIAAGIPSITGSYHERKFDAVSLSFRLESLANTLFEELISSFNLNFVTRASLFQIKKYVSLFSHALQLDGVFSNRLETTLELLLVALEVRRFSFSQYIDIFRGLSEALQDILNTYYSGLHKNNLRDIILQTGIQNIEPKYIEQGKHYSESEFINTVSELFLREVVATSFGLQQLDSFISRILKTLYEQSEVLDVQNLDLLMSYDQKKAISGLHSPNMSTDDRIHLGNKGYNLVKLSLLDVSVPPGFIITTEVFRCLPTIRKFKYAAEHLDEEIRLQMKDLEKMTGKGYGDPGNPLLVSVRSGAAISMPGMMNSFLNVGINEEIVQGMIKQTDKPWFAWDCYRRFLQCWGMSFGIERNKFDHIMRSFKKKYNVDKKIQFRPEQMKDVALAYRNTVTENGIVVPDDPQKQLEITVAEVFESWFSRRAKTYREILGISDSWGTAVIVQTMVYGNLDTDSGTGVLFTRNPKELGDRVMLWGDFTIGAQGEDVVSGLVKTLPISNEQRDTEERTQETTLEEAYPEIYDKLLKTSKELIYDRKWGAQEIEFTFDGKESVNLYVLQARDMSIIRKESFIAFVPSPELTANYLSRGIGVGGGALSGRVVFDLDDIQEFRKSDPATPLILIRADTVPDDIPHISAAEGILTALGGSTSHAAIVANRLGKTCVVGCSKLFVWEIEKKCTLNRKTIRVGDYLSIDGRNGLVYAGVHDIQVISVLS